MLMKRFLIFLFVIPCLLACGNHSTNNSGDGQDSDVVINENDDVAADSDSIDFAYDEEFANELAENQKDDSDEDRACALAEAGFWEGDSLEHDQYVILFNYLLDHNESELEGPIADFIFEYFKSDNHCKEFDSYFKLYSDPSLLESLTFEILSSWSNENESISESDFKAKFPYLFGNGCVKYFKSFMALEN